MSGTPVVRLKRGKERKVRNFYPWIQRGECRAEGVADGEVADLVDADGDFLARGTYNSQSRFLFRVLSLDKAERIDEAFFFGRIQEAERKRKELITGTDSYRLVFGEADGLSGLIVDRYVDQLIVQVRSLGMERLKPLWMPALQAATGARGAYERSEMAGRAEEGLEPVAGLLFGEVPESIPIIENGLRYIVPLKEGLKTGFYLDQRETRRQFREAVQPGQKVLDAFCYSGSFALNAAKAGALAYGVDIHTAAIESAREHATTNGLEAVFVEANVFDWLKADTLGPYDWIVLDPPAIAKTESKRNSLKWAIWRLVHDALPILKPGGRMIVCNCSYQLSLTETVETCRLAGSDRGRQLYFERVTLQDLDHPAPIHFPEALYLKCVWLRG
ncbi:MAG: class I SAM-dependent rRNA methyltransferase [Fimbriimonadaceae bacterium]|nr:class I SAM-dependent rRNA methyltransferase [Fimbriimonadaceae bacterium]QYK56771.1 MAG: class I SAM-dependent rRNA methyltransferase [Fimbriimonadaceae bacterium]